MKVTIREKLMQGGKVRLYLDFYPPIVNPGTGKTTRREFLTLFLHSDIELKDEKFTDDNGKTAIRTIPVFDKKNQPKKAKLTPLQRQHNKETMELAENIKAQRQLKIQAEDYGFLTQDRNADFLEKFKTIADQRKEKYSDNNYLAVYNYLHKFTNGVCPVGKVTKDFCNDFKEYIISLKAFTGSKNTTLSNGTAITYFAIFSAVLNRLTGTGKPFADNPAAGISVEKIHTKQRGYLTIEELQKLQDTPCDIDYLKRAAIFSALTGLRYSDVEALKWGDIVEEGGKVKLSIIVKKTNTPELMTISKEAVQIAGERKDSNTHVFEGLKYNSWQNYKIENWVRAAGINKHITFHNFRHTYATIHLYLGTDLMTISKNLSHSNIKTTQIYAKVVDKLRDEAAAKEMIKL